MIKQIELLKQNKRAHGGLLLKSREGRKARPVDTRNTMHVMLRSSQATGDFAFRKHAKRIGGVTARFAEKYGVRVITMIAVGDHIHMLLKLRNAEDYAPFIRATTAAISMTCTGASRWNPLERKFWDYRPFTRSLASGQLDFDECLQMSEGAGRAKACLIIGQA